MQHRIGFVLGSVVVALWLYAPGVVQGAVPTVPWDVREEVLDNGLKVLLLHDSRAPVVTFMVWYRVGARNERLGSTGVAHLLEHMMFKGTKTYGPRRFSNLIQRHGGRLNAFTGQDYTAYFERLVTEHVEIAIKLEADRMRHLAMEPEAFRLERQVVQEERRRRVEDQPIAFLWEQLRAAAYQAHPYGWPVIGWSTDLPKLTLEEAQRFYDLYYAPNNAFLVVVGQFEDDVVLDMIRQYFGPVPPGAQPPPVEAREPEQHGSRRVTVQRPAHLPYFAVAYHVPTYDHDDAFALEIMTEILGGSQSARLVQTLQREKQLVLATGAGYDGASVDPPLLTIAAQPAPNVSVAAVEAAVWDVIDALKRQPLAPAELERVKRHLTTAYVIRLDSQFSRALTLGRAEMAQTWQWLNDYLPKIAAVKPEDVQRVARKYLRAENRTVGILDPLPLTESAERQRVEPPVTTPLSTPEGHIR